MGSQINYPPAPGYSSQMPMSQTDSKAIVGLILSIGSWVVCPVLLAIIALVLASQSNRDIAASGGRLSGQGLNTATKVISWINIVLSVLSIVAFVGFLIFAAVSGWVVTTPTPLDTGF